MKKIKFITKNEKETIVLAKIIAKTLKKGDVIALIGALGAGKTHFSKGIALGLGINENIVSPTFTILNFYEAPTPLVHLDFYRLESVEELENVGFFDYLKENICLIEWADKFLESLPEKKIIIRIKKQNNDNERLLELEGFSDYYENIKNEVENYVVSD